MLLATGRVREAEPLYRRALAIDEKALGPEDPKIGVRLNNLAALLRATGRRAEAEPLMKRVVLIFLNFSRTTRTPHPNLADALSNYAAFLLESGKTEDQTMSLLREIAPEFFS